MHAAVFGLSNSLCSDVLCFSNESCENLSQNDSFKYSDRVDPNQTHEPTTDE